MTRPGIELSVAALRANLSAALNTATRGGITYVTSHNRRVALVGPLSLADDHAILHDLLTRGVLTTDQIDEARRRIAG